MNKIYSLISSIGIHLIIFGLLAINLSFLPEKEQRIRVIPIKKLGVETSSADSVLIQNDVRKNKLNNKSTSRKLSLESLKAPTHLQDSKESQEHQEHQDQSDKISLYQKELLKSKKRRFAQNQLKQKVLSQKSSQSEAAQIVSFSDLNMQIVPPRGVSYDKLNSFEKKFYGFQKRTFIKFINSFMSEYNQVRSVYPQIKNDLIEEEIFMTARAVFDQNGNIISIKFIRWNDNDYIQNLFEGTIEGITHLPNPPKEILNNDSEFTIYFSLRN